MEQEPTIDALLARHRVPGAAWAIVDTDTWTTGTAGIDPATRRPVTRDTQFQIGSLSKSFCALVACLLVDDGTVPWNDDLASWAADTNGLLQRNGHDGAVTVARLLSHTAGVGVHGFVGYAPDEPIPTQREVVLGRFEDASGSVNSGAVTMEIDAGVEFRYSGGGYQLLELALEEVTGDDFAALVDRLVLWPASMSATGFAEPPDPSAGSFDGEVLAEHHRRYPERAAAGLWSTVDDLARWHVELLAARRDPDHHWHRAVTLMATPANVPASTDDEAPQPGGHGLRLDSLTTPRWAAHRGRTLGFAATNALGLGGRHAAIALTNGFPGGSEVGDELIVHAATAHGWHGWRPMHW
ncbi:MAG: serine hydrolase domain-containing protein [Actinomycetota bacterium]